MFKLYTHREKGEPANPLTNQEQQLITSNQKQCDFYWFLLRTARIFGSPVHGWNYLALFPLQNPGLHILREHNPEITNLDFAGLVSCATGGPNKINVFKRGLPSERQQPSFWVPCKGILWRFMLPIIMTNIEQVAIECVSLVTTLLYL